MQHYRECQNWRGGFEKFRPIVFVGCASQAPKSRCEIGKGPSSYNSISRASRSFPRSSNLPVGRRGMRIVQKVCRLQPLRAISVRKVLKLACSSVYLPREFSHKSAINVVSKTFQRSVEKLLSFLASFFVFILIISNDDILHNELKQINYSSIKSIYFFIYTY